jgi:pyruvate dehydrogenase E2 component (dihydrolipoamide acetyltransferase)
MPTPILMPALSPTMEQGKLAKWLKKEGDRVASGDVIAEIETDKATMEVEAVDEGVLGKIVVAEGTEGVPVNTPIGILLGDGEDASAISEGATPHPHPLPQGEGVPPQPLSGRSLSNQHPLADADALEKQARQGELARERDRVRGDSPSNGAKGRIFASPLARRLASAAGIDLAQLNGSGPHGRIVKHDVDEAKRAGPAPKAPEPVTAPFVKADASRDLTPVRAFLAPMPDDHILAIYEPGSYEVRPLDNMRKTIAQRLTQAAATIPHFRLNVDCEIGALQELREKLNAGAPKEGPGAYKLSVNDFIVKALGLALQRVPEANATFTERGILIHKASDVGVAVAIEGGLFTPVIRGVEHKTLSEISAAVKDLAARAKKRRLAPHEYQGGTTAISNLGMFGIDNFDAVINPPHATILAVGRGEKRAIVKGDQIVAATMMSCTLSCDHRVVDGALGAQLLAAFKALIEEPFTMLV